MASPVASRGRLDPRLYQIAALTGLLVYGLAALDLPIALLQVALSLAAALAAQLACTRLVRLPRFDPQSALISGLSLCLLLRTGEPGWAAVAAVLAITSKFALRIDGRHVFNPTNFGLLVTLSCGGDIWISAGQWGSTAFFGFLMACVGGLVVQRAARSDVALAFLLAHAAILFGRSFWLGEPLAIPLHRLQNGALLLFAFFMLSDPKTTPDSRHGRLLFATAVALGAGFVQFVLLRNNGLLWSLLACAPLVPLLNRLLPGRRYAWPAAREDLRPRKEFAMQAQTLKRRALTGMVGLAIVLWVAVDARAFCGFYVARAGTQLFNKASRVVLVRDGDRTVLTMANDFKGDPTEFAMVVPVPTVLEREQIHVGDMALLDHLDAYTAPRLVEYHDDDPCRPRLAMERYGAALGLAGAAARKPAAPLGVTIEATYTVGEYDIVILSAAQSGGLETWLVQNGYNIPRGASKVLGSYIKQGMRFFVAKVNLEQQSALGYTNLRPLQLAFETPKFMLPIRLGMVNADGPQELFVYVLTRTGRVETTNYRTVRLPTGMDLPTFVEGEFEDFYRDMFSEQVRRESMRTVFLEYAWDMGWCDPCAADPLSAAQLRELGAFWVDAPAPPKQRPDFLPPGATDIFVSRLHLRYDAAHFPEDLIFQHTRDRTNFQGRYVLRHPWTGALDCDAGEDYRRALRKRQEEEARQLAALTGWDLQHILDRMQLSQLDVDPERSWWSRLWER